MWTGAGGGEEWGEGEGWKRALKEQGEGGGGGEDGGWEVNRLCIGLFSDMLLACNLFYLFIFFGHSHSRSLLIWGIQPDKQ